MNLHLTGHHLEITPAIRDYVSGKLARITGHGAPLLFEGHCGPPVP